MIRLVWTCTGACGRWSDRGERDPEEVARLARQANRLGEGRECEDCGGTRVMLWVLE